MSTTVAEKITRATEPMNQIDGNSRRIASKSLIDIVLGTVLLAFTTGRWIVPLAAWLAPVFLIRFLRSQRVLRGILLVELALMGAMSLTWWGMVPGPAVVHFLAVAMLVQIVILPLAIDRLVAVRLSGLPATLVFPTAWAATEYLASLASPYSSGNAVAYTQYGNLPLLQILSITGLWGVTFLIGWFASTVNFVWEQEYRWSRIRSVVVAYSAVLGAVLLFGGGRLALFPPTAETVRIASLTASDEIVEQVSAAAGPQTDEFTDERWESARQALPMLHEHLLERTRQEARAGASIVFWPEGHAQVLKEDESVLIEQGSTVAKEEGIYLCMGMLSIHRARSSPKFENKLVIIDPQGEVAAIYYKQRPVPGGEAALSVIPLRDDKLPILDTPHGRLAAAICFDMDFPNFIRQAGEAGTDILLAPSNDWKEVDPLHTYMAVLRSIELGCSVVRHCSNGLSLAVDHQGRVRAAMDHFTTPSHDRVMIAQVPTRGTKTIYAQFGDLFGWACVAGLVILCIAALRKSPNVS